MGSTLPPPLPAAAPSPRSAAARRRHEGLAVVRRFHAQRPAELFRRHAQERAEAPFLYSRDGVPPEERGSTVHPHSVRLAKVAQQWKLHKPKLRMKVQNTRVAWTLGRIWRHTH